MINFIYIQFYHFKYHDHKANVFEGNYLDGLMSRPESIYNLLRAILPELHHRVHPFPDYDDPCS